MKVRPTKVALQPFGGSRNDSGIFEDAGDARLLAGQQMNNHLQMHLAGVCITFTAV